MKFSSERFLRAVAVLALLSVPLGCPVPLLAAPSGEIVISGSFKMENLGSTLKITQQGQKGIIQWDSFSIKAGEITQFVQPNSSASVLNRVTGSTRSEIMGQLLANGNLWLINPNGILVGPGGRIDVGGLVLSTLDISNEDFLLGGDARFSGNSNAAITNFGTINAAQGDVYVMAQRVENNGLIGAVDGRIVLAADNEIFLEKKTGNVFLSGQVGHGHVLNNGEIVAADVLLKARNNNVYAMAVQNNGTIRAQKADKSGGRVRLIAEGGAGVAQAGTINVDGTTGGKVEISSEGAVQLSGSTTARGLSGGGEIVVKSLNTGGAVNVGAGASVDASTASLTGGKVELKSAGLTRNDGMISAASASGAGGSVAVTGNEVALGTGSSIDVSGGTNGGSAKIGGGLAGRDSSLSNAVNTTVENGAVIRADGAAGNGGVVAVWADRDTEYRGSTSVRGAINGGFAEVSGKNLLTFAGAVDLAGSTGTNGTLLLDPVNVRISQGALAPGAINADDLVSAWGTGNVVVHTGGSAGDLGNIEIDSNVSMLANTANSLSFFAHNNITVAKIDSASVAGATRILNSGTGNINLVSGWDGTGESKFTPSGTDQIGSTSLAINASQIINGDYGAYGLKGTIEINPNAANQVIIASAQGETNLFGNNITLAPGDATGEFAQIGWFHDGSGADSLASPFVKGNINVYAKGNLVATNTVASGTDWRYVQIGHGGRMISANAGVQDRVLAGDVTVNVGGSLLGQSGGANNGWFKIGHGGKADGADVRVNTYGNISVTAGSMTFQVNAAGSNVDARLDNFIQIGNGGVNVRGEHAGNVTVNATKGAISVLGSRVTQNAEGTNARNFFQIGHGGYNSDHTVALPIDFDGRVLIGDEITTIGELGTNSAVDGGDLAAANRLLTRTGTDANGFAIYGVRTAGKIGHAGNISVTALGNITLEAGGRQQAYAQIGHGGILTAGEHGSWDWDGDNLADGNITVTSTKGAIALTRNIVEYNNSQVRVVGFGTQAFVQIGHGGYFSSGGYNGNVSVTAGAGNISMYGGQSNAFAKIGHGGIGNTDPGAANFLRGVREHGRDFAAGDILGNITVNASGNIIIRGGVRSTDSFAQIGHGGFRVYATDDFVQGNDMNGSGGADTFGAFKGDVLVQAGGVIDAYAGQKNANHRDGADPLLSGQIEAGMAGIRNFVMIGHGGLEARSDASGAITVTSATGDVRMEAVGGWDAFDASSNLGTEDSGTENFAMIGHGGRNSEHSMRGDNPFAGDQRGSMAQNSVENFIMFDRDGDLTTLGDRQLVLPTSLKTSDFLTGRMVHYDSPIGWQIDRLNANATPTNTTGTNSFTLGTGDTLASLNIGIGTAVFGTGIPTGAVVTGVTSPNQFQISANTTAALTGTYQFLNNDLGTTQLNIDNPLGIIATTATPTGAINTNVLTFGGSDTVANLSVQVGREITGAGVPAGTVVSAILSPYSIRISNNLSAATSANYTFAGDRVVTTTTAPTGAINTNVLTLGGSDTVSGLLVGVGHEVTGAGIPAGTFVTAVLGPNSVRLSNNLSAAASGNYSFAVDTYARQVRVGDRFSVENHNAVYEVTGVQKGTGGAIGDRLVTFRKVGAAPGTGTDVRIDENTNLFFVTPGGATPRYVTDPIQEQNGVGRREVQSLSNLPANGGFTLSYVNPSSGLTVTTGTISVDSLTATDTIFNRIKTALEATSGTAGSNFFSVLPSNNGSLYRVQFQGGVFDNANIDTMSASNGVTVSTNVEGTAAGNTSYLFTTLAVPGASNAAPVNRNNPEFSASVNPEFAEFINTMNAPTNFALGWSGDITVTATKGNVRMYGAQRSTLETNPYQGNSILPTGANTSTKNVPESAVRGYAQIGHGGSDTQIDSYVPTAGHSGNITVTAGGALTMLAGDFVRQVESGQVVTVTLVGSGTPTPLTFNNKTSVDSRENYVMIGHGGVATANGPNVTGNISVTTGADVTLRAGRGTTAFAMIGHGGRDTTANTLNRSTTFSGNINVDAGGGVDIEAGSRERAFAMIGHGGADFEDTNIASVGPIVFMDDQSNGTTQPDIRTLTDTVYRTQLVNGSFSRLSSGNGVGSLVTDQTFEVASILGNIDVVARGVHSLTGEGLTILGGQKTTAIVVTSAGALNGDGVLGRWAQIGHGGGNMDARIGLLNSDRTVNTGNINVSVNKGAVRLQGGILTGDSARIGHGGRDWTGSTVANGLEAGSSFVGNITVNIADGYDLSLIGGVAPTYDINDAAGITGVNGLTKGNLAYFYNPSQDDFTINPTDPANTTALRALETALGLPTGALTGLSSAAAVNAAAVKQMGLLADQRAGRPSQLDGDPALDSNLALGEYYPTSLHSLQAAMAQIGHGGSRLGGAGTLQGIELWEGNINVNTAANMGGRDVILTGGDGMDNFAMIGHGAHEVRAPISVRGDVNVNAGRDLLLKGGDYFANSEIFIQPAGVPNANYGSYAQIGHEFTAANGAARLESSQGNVSATALRDIVLTGGGASYAHAMIGSGAKVGSATNPSNSTSNLSPLGGHNGAVNVVSGRDILLTPAEIREDDAINDVAYSGSLPAARLRNPLQGTFSSAQIGHGGATVSPRTALQGDIRVLAGGNLVAGTGSYVLGSASVPTSLAADTSRGTGAYAKIGHGDYLIYPSSAGTAVPGTGIRGGNIMVATGQDLWSAGMQIGHIDTTRAPLAVSNPNSSSTYVAVSRNNPSGGGTGRIILDRSISNYATTIGGPENVPGGVNQTILATSITSGSGGSDQVRIYMPDRRFGIGNGAAGAATFGLVDSNDMRGRYAAVTDVNGNTLASSFGTIINGIGYDDPENDQAGNAIATAYPTLRGSTLATSGASGDLLGDEAFATEFTYTRDAKGLPVGSFTPQGTFQAHSYGTRYMVYYSPEKALPVVKPPVPPPLPQPEPVTPVPVVPELPFNPSTVNSSNPGAVDRYARNDEAVDGSVFSFESWRDGGSSGQGYWVAQQSSVSSAILPEDLFFVDPAYTGYGQGLPFRIYDLQQLRNWESGVLVYDPARGFQVNPNASKHLKKAKEGKADPFGFGGATDAPGASNGAAPAPAPSPSPDGTGTPPAGGAPADPFGAPAPAMGAPAEDPFGKPAAGAPAMGAGAADPFAPAPPSSN